MSVSQSLYIIFHNPYIPQLSITKHRHTIGLDYCLSAQYFITSAALSPPDRGRPYNLNSNRFILHLNSSLYNNICNLTIKKSHITKWLSLIEKCILGLIMCFKIKRIKVIYYSYIITILTYVSIRLQWTLKVS